MRHRQRGLRLALPAVLLLAGCSGSGDGASAPTPSPSAASEAAFEAVPAAPAPTPTATPAPAPSPEPPPLQGLGLEPVVEGLTEPVEVAVAPDDDRLFVVQRAGTVVAADEGVVEPEPFLDVGPHLGIASIEQGLLGLAFHPRYPDDPRVFAFHSLPDNDNVVVSYAVTGGRADPASRKVLLTIDKEPDKVRHNGGALRFGPDGHLFVGVGDGARASVNGQDPSTLLGAILRLDVDGGDPYAIPPGNPFADGAGGAPEVWWYGLRNPWRFAIDEPTGLAYVADVGQETFEEVDVVPLAEPGLNFGWPVREGTTDFYGGEPHSPVTDPVLVVGRGDTEQGCSITGGVVYRGAAIPELAGHYLYADWCYGWIRSFRYADGQAADQQDWSEQLAAEQVSAFGTDADGEVLVVDFVGGRVSRIVPRR